MVNNYLDLSSQISTQHAKESLESKVLKTCIVSDNMVKLDN